MKVDLLRSRPVWLILNMLFLTRCILLQVRDLSGWSSTCCSDLLYPTACSRLSYSFPTSSNSPLLRTYIIGFSVRSEQYSRLGNRLRVAYIVTQQWLGTNLSESDVAWNWNWEALVCSLLMMMLFVHRSFLSPSIERFRLVVILLDRFRCFEITILFFMSITYQWCGLPLYPLLLIPFYKWSQIIDKLPHFGTKFGLNWKSKDFESGAVLNTLRAYSHVKIRGLRVPWDPLRRIILHAS